jgi:hypothetical protein
MLKYKEENMGEVLMESSKTNETITIIRDDLKAEMRSAFGEFIGEGVKNIGELLINTFCGTSVAVPTQPKAEVTAKPPLSEPVAESAPPPKGELLKIVSGYLYMALQA